jgi:glycosyltransferase involved in cell wall biosynthesis
MVKKISETAPIPLLFHVFPTFDAGGAQIRFVALANHFGPRLRHVIVALDDRVGAATRLHSDVPFRCLEVAVRKKTLAGNLRNFRRVLKSEKPDLLITHNWGAVEWAMAKAGTGIRHIHIEDGFGPDETRGQLWRRVLTRRLVLRHSTTIIPSRTLERIARDVWRLPRDGVHYIPNGIDIERFKRRSNGENPIPVIGTVSALRGEKNLQRLLRAFAATIRRLPCRLVIVGDGPERGALEDTARELSISDFVRFEGHVPDPSSLYGTFDIFVLTSDTEQMPYTVIEAMAASCPIAATDVGDVREMVAAENRPFVVARDENAVSDALVRLLADGDLRKTVGDANLQTARERYSQDTMFRAFAEIYDLPGLTAT